MVCIEFHELSIVEYQNSPLISNAIIKRAGVEKEYIAFDDMDFIVADIKRSFPPVELIEPPTVSLPVTFVFPLIIVLPETARLPLGI